MQVGFILKIVYRAVIYLFLLECLILAIRKLTYKIYRGFSGPLIVQNSLSDFKDGFYWRENTYVLSSQRIRFYCAWILNRFDFYIPIIDCERQAAKAKYFYDNGWRLGMSGFRYRRINPKAWPVFFTRRFSRSLFSLLSAPRNQKLDNFKKASTCEKAIEK